MVIMEIYSLEYWTTGGSSRFENALWRAWAKSRYMLKTIPPENINWLKDSDYNWLYRPLQSSKSSRSALISEPTIALPKHTYLLDKRPILKKQRISEGVLQKLMPALSILKRVGEMHGEEGSASANRTRDCLMIDGQSRTLFAYQIRSKSVRVLLCRSTLWLGGVYTSCVGRVNDTVSASALLLRRLLL